MRVRSVLFWSAALLFIVGYPTITRATQPDDFGNSIVRDLQDIQVRLRALQSKTTALNDEFHQLDSWYARLFAHPSFPGLAEKLKNLKARIFVEPEASEQLTSKFVGSLTIEHKKILEKLNEIDIYKKKVLSNQNILHDEYKKILGVDLRSVGVRMEQMAGYIGTRKAPDNQIIDHALALHDRVLMDLEIIQNSRDEISKIIKRIISRARANGLLE